MLSWGRLLLLALLGLGTASDHSEESFEEAALIQTQPRLQGSCASQCNEKDLGGGYIMGEAPSCAGTCSECIGKCWVVNKNDDLSDYGSGCWTGDKVCCCEHAAPISGDVKDQDRLTVLDFNTFLLEVNVFVTVAAKPDMGVRSSAIVSWFQSLRSEEVPDVVVLEEIFSSDAEVMMQKLCTSAWRKTQGEFYANAKFIACLDDSPFTQATLVANPAKGSNPKKGSGVVILVKKGLIIGSAHDQEFADCAGDDCQSYKGFWLVEAKKGEKLYFIVGTHTNAYEGQEKRDVRKAQFQQIRNFVNSKVPDGARLVIAGDMNIFTGPYEDENGNTVTAIETSDMLAALGGQSPATAAGALESRGFWLPLDTEIMDTVDPNRNHYLFHDPPEKRLGAQTMDWVIVPGAGDKYATPTKARHQVVPVKADICFTSELAGTKNDDLSDHYGVFAELVYAEDMDFSTVQVSGHKGGGPSIPGGPDCN